MKIRTILAAGLIQLAAFSIALAADVTGKWTGEVQGRNGPRPINFTLKADGDKLTGKILGMGGRETDITDGKVNGDEISFTVVNEFNGNTVKILYSGKVSGDELKMKSQREGGDRTQEFTAKREK